jgi:hypothetical protein
MKLYEIRIPFHIMIDNRSDDHHVARGALTCILMIDYLSLVH